jgi:hypothetical protein
VAPLGKRVDGNVRQKIGPCHFEGDARVLEGLGYAGPALARIKTGVKSAGPAALLDIDRNAGALADRADVDVAEINVPGLLVRIVAAGEGAGMAGYAVLAPDLILGVA